MSYTEASPRRRTSPCCPFSESNSSLRGVDRAGFKASRVERNLAAIEALQARGVTVNGCFVLGFDADGPEVFDAVLDFVDRSQLMEVQLTVLTPFPGTPLYDRLKREGRLLRDGDEERQFFHRHLGSYE